MNLLKLILAIQFGLTFTCFFIQIYALCSVKWAIFESKVELGLTEEHGHYGLWSLCTYHKFMPANLDDDGRVAVSPDCDPMNTFFSPGHSRACISFFAICHAFSLLTFCTLLLLRFAEIYHHQLKRKNSEENDLELNPNPAKRVLIIVARLLARKNQELGEEEYARWQIRNKLYAISIAVLATILSLTCALTPSKTLRETDALANVAETNYRVWRGPGFWAQLTTLMLDMLVTTLIVIEVRVVFVLHTRHHRVGVTSTVTTSCGTHDNLEDVIVNPFFRNDSVRSERDHQSREIPISMQMTQPKILEPSTSAKPDSSTTHYVNSKQVRQMKKKNQHLRECSNGEGTAYTNPMYLDE